MGQKKRKWTEKEIRQWYQDTGRITYSNCLDQNVVVHKPNGLGWTVNWANPMSYLLQLVLAAVICFLVALIK